MKILKSIQNNHWHHITENMKGDIFIYEKNSKLAVESWKKSLSLDKSNASKEILNMKINEFNK